VVGLAVAVGISGFLLRDHPAFFFVGLILLLFFVLLAALFSNIYDGVSTAPAFVSYKSEFSKMDYIMSNMPLYLGMIGLLILIVIYAKTV
jgi:hypothetical protein